MTWFTRLAPLALAVVCLSPHAAAQQPMADPLTGRWELDLARTHYGGGAEPRKRETFLCTATTAGVACTIESLRSDGRVVVGGFTGAYDGTPGPTRGIPGVDHVRIRRVNSSIADATFTFEGRPVFAYRAVQATSGHALTIVSVDPETRAVLNSVVAYERR